ncbi:DUF1287 domain-containing protein [Paracoccus pacificus]|uniref:DUF1287 domain-containing protein n=1 Tax=Paracoccus pacificus TaxID=1463598 RepID=A0ABW4RC48_9RHOB
MPGAFGNARLPGTAAIAAPMLPVAMLPVSLLTVALLTVALSIWGAAALATPLSQSAPPPYRAGLAAPMPGGDLSTAEVPATPPEIAAILTAARRQVGVTNRYDPAYTRLDFPGGDVPPDRGVCTDVLIRALREGAQIDLQLAVNRDMSADFSAYPRSWGLKRPDSNIDHRRVPNLSTFLRRIGAEVPAGEGPEDFQPGDIVTMMLPGNLPHILLVSDKRTPDGQRPLVIHNIGAGAREEDALMRFPRTGHYRLNQAAMATLRRLGQWEY